MTNDKFFSEFLAKLASLDRLGDKYWAKQERAEAAGDTAKAAKMDHKMDCISSEIDGMLNTLRMLGYTVQYQPDPVIVEV